MIRDKVNLMLILISLFCFSCKKKRSASQKVTDKSDGKKWESVHIFPIISISGSGDSLGIGLSTGRLWINGEILGSRSMEIEVRNQRNKLKVIRTKVNQEVSKELMLSIGSFQMNYAKSIKIKISGYKPFWYKRKSVFCNEIDVTDKPILLEKSPIL